MRFEKGHKAATRQKIVEIASERFRKDGVAATGIAGLMADAGLTHGGFYAHFESKEALLREAMDAAFTGTKARLERAAEDGGGLEGYVRRYMRPSHRDTPEKGCAVAPLVSEIARHEDSTRAFFTDKLESIVERIMAMLPPAPRVQQKRTAISIFSVMVGALQISRAVTDKEFSDEILESGIQAALRLAE
jgi:AcrR family transcriptional regulator